MKSSILFGILIFFVGLMPVCKSQNLLSHPESIIYDSLHYRYLVSNWPTGDIIQIDSNGNQSYFAQGVLAFNGLAIVGNVVYVGSDSLIRGFDLQSGSMVMDVHVTGFNNLNDVTADTSGNLYASDLYGTRIIKLNISTQNWWVFVDGNGISRPNGIFYDKPFNRILVCSYRYHSPIQAINLADSSVTTLTTTNLTHCDGITKDKYGRCYVTSTRRYIYRFDTAFSDPPELVYTNTCCPADISYNEAHNVIAIPLQSCDNWDTLTVDTSVGIGNDPASTSTDLMTIDKCFPNPAKDHTRIDFTLKKREKVTLSLYEAEGREQYTFMDEVKNQGSYSIDVDLTSITPGIYFVYLKVNSQAISKKLIIVK
jgi:sugar lactone lactonase YvrE